MTGGNFYVSSLREAVNGCVAEARMAVAETESVEIARHHENASDAAAVPADAAAIRR